MIEVSIAGLAICVLAVMSILANDRFRSEDRLPMQWSLDGSVNWTASRLAALTFTPSLAAIILLATAASITFLQPRPGQEGFLIPTMLVVALAFIGVHALHLWLIANYLRRNG